MLTYLDFYLSHILPHFLFKNYLTIRVFKTNKKNDKMN